MAGVLPSDIVVFNVPVESCLGITTGDRLPRGLVFGEHCSDGRRTISDIIFVFGICYMGTVSNFFLLLGLMEFNNHSL